MKRVVALPVLATMFVLMVLQTTLPVQTSEAASRITVPRDYPTIQAAINAANPGDTIKVLPGTYTEQIVITKDLKIIGSGAKSTVIKAPAVLNPSPFLPFPGRANIVDIFSEAKVVIKGLTITGPSGAICPGLAGVRVTDSSTLGLDYSSIKGCTREGMLVGLSPTLPTGPQVGHATVSNTEITQYRLVGIQAGGPDTTIKLSRSSLVAANAPEVEGQVGVVIAFGAKGIISNNRVSGNICNHPSCGPDFLNQVQGTAIFAVAAASGSSITNNVISNNDLGIAVALNSGCCEVDRNILKNNRFFGIAVVDGEHTVSNTKITGGNVGVLAAAFSIDTVATLDRVVIKGTTTPTQELSVGATAEVVFKPSSVITTQSAASSVVPMSMPLPLPGVSS
jgi:nitrous oxidase accessory protein NosD